MDGQPNSAGSIILLNLPIEIRHKIFEHVNWRNDDLKQLLRDWLDIADPNIFRHPAANHVGDHTDESDHQEGDDDEDGDEDEGDEDDDEGMADNEQDTDSDDGMSAEDDDDDDEMTTDDNNITAVQTAGAVTTTTSEQLTAPPVLAPRNRVRTKYRHTVGMFGLSAFPPPPNLLCVCRQLRDEALDHFYDTAVLTINVSKGFRHFSFFEETLQLLSDAAYSPLESIRKVQLIFVWNSEFLSTDELSDKKDICSQMLQVRTSSVINVLTKMPNLRNVDTVWLDSIPSEHISNEEARREDTPNDEGASLRGTIFDQISDFQSAKSLSEDVTTVVSKDLPEAWKDLPNEFYRELQELLEGGPDFL